MEVRTAEGSVPWVNASGMEISDVEGAVGGVARQLAKWIKDSRGSQKPSIFNRAAYVAPDNPYSQMEAARNAVESDDIVGGVADVTEALMFQGVKWESPENDEADIFNQISRDLNLDEFLRQWHREEYTHSQVVVGMWWGQRQYTYRGKTESGKRSKKVFDVRVPTALTFLDPRKVVPLPPGPFGQDRLAWRATEREFAIMANTDGSYVPDAVLAEFTTGPLTVDRAEESYLESIGVDPKRLLGINEAAVFRICRTKMSYERFPHLRLKNVFPLLDLKAQLMEADRVALVGAINFILLVKQGSKDEPALPEEIENLKENFKVVARLPVVIGDHRLNIEIITPDQEHVLDGAKYDTIDRRILNRCLGALSIGGSGQRNESTLTIARGVARLLESRRHMMKRALEQNLARAVVEHPSNVGKFIDEPNLVYSPRNVQLDNDAAMIQAILSLRTQNELSRESTLEYFQFDQLTEAMRRENEKESGLDDTFETRVPFSSPDQGGAPDDGTSADNQDPAESPQVSGGRGGRPAGGGRSKQSVKGRNGNRADNGQASSKGTGA
jgi:hypothetical protein